ncbi:MAG: VWA domain-containing protein, partial [Mesorhizobium sp.]
MTTLGLAADRVVIVLDASGSMWAQIDGKPKLEIARESLRTVLQSVPADKEIGFMAYGHREKGSCEDIELIVPPQAGSAGAVSTAADSLKFIGKTPLTSAVRRAAEALKYTEDKATVILITDGLETCKGDPCALGKELRAAGVDFTVNVVGFG